MTKRFTQTEELIHAYTNTPATAKKLASQFGISRTKAELILRDNLDPKLHEKLKTRKLSQSVLRSKLSQYMVQHGL